LLASVGANVALTLAARAYFAAAGAVRLDPAGLQVYAADRARPRGEQPLVVLFGDSRALMWTNPAVPSGYRVVNRGIGRQTTAQMLLRFDADVAPLRPNVVVFEGGVNDLKEIADFPEKRAEIVADCEAHIARIVDQCRGLGATVILTTVFDIGDVALWRRPFWSADVEAAVREVNAFLPRLAGERVVLFDAGPVLGDGRGAVKREYQVDHLHLLPAGYAALNQRLTPLIAGLPSR
jgi:lysophospholipase L1-like esterase